LSSELTERIQQALGTNYLIERELGGGGMSRVFLADDRSLGRKVVVKVLPPELAADISSERFAREIKVSARLQHPQIVSVLSAGDAAGLPYYVMPFVEGEGLRERIGREGKLPLRDVVSILRDVAKALAFAHGKNVVHRDIKPENVLLSGNSAVVADFGIAKAIGAARTNDGSAHSATLTSVGTTVGTPAYMAPEQAAGDPDTDSRADLYSFGCMGYEMLAGHGPFLRDSVHKLVAAHISETPRPIAELRPDCPRPLASLIMRCLAKDPADRPQSAGDLITALDEVHVTQSGAFEAFATGRNIPLVLVAAAVLAVAAFGVVRFRGRPRPSPGIAVLPFKNLGGDSASAYFGEGIAEDLALTLRSLPGVQVASQTSSQAVQNRRMTIHDIGEALGVGSVLEGSVRRDGGHIHLNATLSSASDGRVLWSDAFDRDAKQLFEVQNDLAQSIAKALSLRLSDAARPSAVRGTTDVAAYDLYLRGRHEMTQGYTDRGAIPAAVSYFEEAIARDSSYARAYSGYADALSLLPFFNRTPFDSVVPIMFPAARRAISLDPKLGEAHASLGRAYGYKNLRDSAEREYKISIQLDPNYASVEQWLGSLLCGEGRIKECFPHSRRAAELDPLNTAFAQYYANSLVLMGRNVEADSAITRAIRLDSGVINAPVARQVLLDVGRYEDVVRAAQKLHQPWGESVYALVRLGRRADADSVAREGLARAQTSGGTGLGSLSDALLAAIGLGDTAAALDLLDRERGSRHRYPTRSLSDPLFDPIRGSPRFAAYVVRLGFDPKVLAAGRGGRP
jgi:eukaryotic-like serine/threonine-protein kinase